VEQAFIGIISSGSILRLLNMFRHLYPYLPMWSSNSETMLRP